MHVLRLVDGVGVHLHAQLMDLLHVAGVEGAEARVDLVGPRRELGQQRLVGTAGRTTGTDGCTSWYRAIEVGTLLYEPVLLTLRRMAHEAVSARS